MSNRQTGAKTIYFTFFDEVDEIFNKTPNVNNVKVASSLKPIHVNYSDNEKENGTDQGPSTSESHRKRKKDSSETLSEIFNKKEKLREKRHQELMEQRQKAIDDFKQMFTKLMEKF